MSSRSCVRQRWTQTSCAGWASETRTTRLGTASIDAMPTAVMAHADDPRTALLLAARVRVTLYCRRPVEISFDRLKHATNVHPENCGRDPSHDGFGPGLPCGDL